MKPLEGITALLQRRIGLNDQALGRRVVEHAIQRRLAQRELACAEEYWLELRQSDAELAHLVDELVVPESWFLRDRKPFQLLGEYASRLRRNPLRKGPLRVLSAPCAAGEEPYSVAMTLREAGLAPTAFVIDAVDISEKLLSAARRMVYRSNSFRGMEPAFQKRFFEKMKTAEFCLLPAVQASVRFFRGNLVEPGFGRDLEPYDVIFCRNLLIYLDQNPRRQVLAHIERLLIPGGLLVVGHAEAGSVSLSRFAPANMAGSFAFYKREDASVSLPAARVKSEAILPSRMADCESGDLDVGFRGGQDAAHVSAGGLRRRIDSGTASVGAEIPVPPARGFQTGVEIELDALQGLADSGNLKDAAALCAEYLARHRTCPRGLFLLGVVRMAEGAKREAEELFNQVVYLEPRHTEAMIHLAHLAEARGESTLARRWRQRVDRLQPRPVAS
ncbi:MAG: CheR family methyltransferase [Limisphaerales bacterium]